MDDLTDRDLLEVVSQLALLTGDEIRAVRGGVFQIVREGQPFGFPGPADRIAEMLTRRACNTGQRQAVRALFIVHEVKRDRLLAIPDEPPLDKFQRDALAELRHRQHEVQAVWDDAHTEDRPGPVGHTQKAHEARVTLVRRMLSDFFADHARPAQSIDELEQWLGRRLTD